MLTFLTKITIELHKLLFFFLPHYPVQWEQDYSKVYLSKSWFSWFVWGLSILDGLFIAAGNAYVVICHFFKEKRQHFHFTHIFIFVAGGVLAVTVNLLIGIALRRKKQLVTGYNYLLKLDAEMTQGKFSETCRY